MLHADAIILNFIQGESNSQKIALIKDTILKILGKDGLLLVPTFTYSFIEKKKINILKDKSEVGLFSELMRKLDRKKRSLNPIFNFLILGNKKKISGYNSNDCLGNESIFNKFHIINGKIITLGCGFNRITFALHVEEMFGVKHRYYKYFNGKLIYQNKISKIKNLRYFVRNLSLNTNISLYRLKKTLIKKKLIKVIKFSRISAELVNAKDFYRTSYNALKKNEFSLIEEGVTNKKQILRNYQK